MCCPFLCNLTSQSIETYGKINLVGIWAHSINTNRLYCQSEKWADMGTFNTECLGYQFPDSWTLCDRSFNLLYTFFATLNNNDIAVLIDLVIIFHHTYAHNPNNNSPWRSHLIFWIQDTSHHYRNFHTCRKSLMFSDAFQLSVAFERPFRNDGHRICRKDFRKRYEYRRPWYAPNAGPNG